MCMTLGAKLQISKENKAYVAGQFSTSHKQLYI